MAYCKIRVLEGNGRLTAIPFRVIRLESRLSTLSVLLVLRTSASAWWHGEVGDDSFT